MPDTEHWHGNLYILRVAFQERVKNVRVLSSIASKSNHQSANEKSDLWKQQDVLVAVSLVYKGVLKSKKVHKSFCINIRKK